MTPFEQLVAWANEPETEIFINVNDGNSPFAVTYRGMLKQNERGFYLRADEIITPIRGIAINVPANDPSVTLSFTGLQSKSRYVAIRGRSKIGADYVIVVTNTDPIDELEGKV